MVEEGLRGGLEQNVSMSRYVSWRAGGVARSAYTPADLDDLSMFMAQLPVDEPVWLVGLGSNLLVRDGGLDATIVFMHPGIGEIKKIPGDLPGHEVIYAQAGAASPKVARFCAKHGLAGGTFLAGIPGTIGGALAMNAGCFGSQTWNFVDEVHTINRQGVIQRRNPEDFEVCYRSVRSKLEVEEWFVGATLAFEKTDPELVREEIRTLMTSRLKSQPLDWPNSGSVFRNPPGDYAARLIEESGLKGFGIGGAQVSHKHANFIINTGGASATDIEAVIEAMEEAVLNRFGIKLVREVRIIGVRTR